MDPDEEDVVLHRVFGRKVKRLGYDRVKKSGPSIRKQEAETLQFIAANTTIPVPKVHDTDWQDGRMTAIIMDYIPGKTLEDVWDDLTHEQKLSIAQELHGYISQLRNLKGDYIGAVNRGKALIGRRSPLECGPFDSERAFNRFLLEDIVQTAPKMLRHYARYALLHNHEIVFTHGDFVPRNIIIGEDKRVAGIIDWEESGWYPEHWEYIKAFFHLQPMTDWPDYLTHILPPKYEREYMGMLFLNPILYH